MKKITVSLLLAFAVSHAVVAKVPDPVVFPDVPGYYTLKMDFHIHTCFSDGTVWPATRVSEAWYEGLDGISITDHLDTRLQKLAGRFPCDSVNRNTSWQLSLQKAASRGMICIHGGEISLGKTMFPGHFNVHFISDGNSISRIEDDILNSVADPRKAHETALLATLSEARRQGAFIVWNHPNWAAQAPQKTEFLPIHKKIFKEGLMDGIEIVNQISGLYSPEAFHWAVEKNLTIVSGTDAHAPMFETIDWAVGEHRPMTLVFAKGKSEPDVREALDNRRTAVVDNNKVYGHEFVLEPFAKACLTVEKVMRKKNRVSVYLKNNSSVPLCLSRIPGDNRIAFERIIRLSPQETVSVNISIKDEKAMLEPIVLDFHIDNFEVDAGVPLKVHYCLE